MRKHNIVVDENIAHPECFELFGNVLKVNGREISYSTLKDCDFLIIRSVTKVDKKLLHNTKVKFVGTVTSGFEHVDFRYLSKNNIHFANAKGCNAFAVTEYVITSITKLLADSDEEFNDKTVGIVGYGNIGTKVAKMCKALGMKIKLNDPPLQKIDNSFHSFPLDEILKCDIVTLHIPLTNQGKYKTFNLIDENLKLLNENSILINTSRGGVINESKTLELLNNKNIRLVIDVWENEPDINPELLAKSDIATPHIAGYSTEGKVNGTKMVFEQLNKFLKTDYKFDFLKTQPENQILKFEDELSPKSLHNLLQKIYNVEIDSLKMKKMLGLNSEERKLFFDEYRKNYPQRKSFNNFIIKTSNVSTQSVLENLRLRTESI